MRKGTGLERRTKGETGRSGKFFQKKDSVWARIIKPGGQTQEVWVSSAFSVVGLSRNARSCEWGAGIAFADPDGVVHQRCILLGELISCPRDVISRLANEGLVVHASRMGMELFAEHIQSSIQQLQTRISVKSVGFGGERFAILPSADSILADEANE